MSITGVGDAIINRRVRQLDDAGFLKAVECVRAADVAFANFESVTPRLPATPSASPIAVRVGVPPYVVDELAWAGFSMLNVANNHTDDWGTQGLLDTLAEMDRRDVHYAGAGPSLAQARAPRYQETSKGRVALIGVTSSDAEIFPASDAGGTGVLPRPGINPLRFETEYRLPAAELQHLRRIDQKLGTAASHDFLVSLGFYPETQWDEKPFSFLGKRFVESTEPPAVVTQPRPSDLEAIQRNIGEAARQADCVVVSLHAHESVADGWNMAQPASFIPTACRAFVDAGADVVFGHGPHQLRAVEIYNERPIFYSLGNFLFMLDTVSLVAPEDYAASRLAPDSTPADLHDFRRQDAHGNPRGFHKFDEYWESVIATVEFQERECVVTVVPVQVTSDGPQHLQGIPRRLQGTDAQDVLVRLNTLSAELSSTQLEITSDGDGPAGRIVFPLTPCP
jgi:poly-gamma-glutamate capsule biosynthesis protein CapA/YwtB (metallophosphatase superfamily)